MKTYTNSQIMDMMDKGHYIQGDKVKGDKGQSGWYDESENMFIYKDNNGIYKGLEFAKGDLWELDLVDRWEEVDIKEAVRMITQSKCDVKLTSSERHNTTMIYKVGEVKMPFEVNSFFILHGSWYKKVNRNEI